MAKKKKNEEASAAPEKQKPKKKKSRKGIRYPDKKIINLVRFELEKDNTMDFLVIVLVILLLVAFAKFAVFDQLAALAEAQRQYHVVQEQLMDIRAQNARYDEVQEEYDKVTDWYLTESEKAVIDKMDVLAMLEDDLMPYVEVKTISVNGTTVSVQTGLTTLDIVSQFLLKLQADPRNRTATVTTTSAAGRNGERDTVVASVIIDFTGATDEEMAEFTAKQAEAAAAAAQAGQIAAAAAAGEAQRAADAVGAGAGAAAQAAAGAAQAAPAAAGGQVVPGGQAAAGGQAVPAAAGGQVAPGGQAAAGGEQAAANAAVAAAGAQQAAVDAAQQQAAQAAGTAQPAGAGQAAAGTAALETADQDGGAS